MASRVPRSTKGKVRGSAAPAVDGEQSIEELPVLPAKDLVAFPSVMMALYVSRTSSIRAIETALEHNTLIFIVTQRNPDTDDPRGRDLYKVGVIANVVRTLKLPDERYKVLIQGISRARALSYRRGEYLTAKVVRLSEEKVEINGEHAATVGRIRENLQVLVEHEHLPEEMLLVSEDAQDVGSLTDMILAHYRLEIEQAQAALEELDPFERLKVTDSIISNDLMQFLISERIRDRARDELNKGQKEYFLREQIKQIQEELGEGPGSSDDLDSLREALTKLRLPEAAGKEAFKQLSRLEKMASDSSEYALLRTYLDWIADLPWNERTRDQVDLSVAKKILDQDHFGLEKVKDRILEYLSVRKLNKDIKGPILCFVGPPGVGKTSLGQSIARALKRRFFRMSLGGVRDEAEIRGHRRTYVGALPGRILQGMKVAGSRNPVFVLDELDKVGTDFRGDPASALLEVLDPQQNREFRDHYLNMSFDLSEVLFVATANTIDTIPEALFDRLEVIYISGYTTREKEQIAERFLIPRQLKENGLDSLPLRFEGDAVTHLIERYTEEAGVRNLEREVGSLLRKIARKIAEDSEKITKVTITLITKLLGPTKFDPEVREGRDLVGLVRGLAWTLNGGEVMPVEASVAKGSGTLSLTGHLGTIMQESAHAALFYARANAEALGLDANFHQKFDTHVHVPSGATPKDGPSAGITIATAIISALSGRPVSSKVAMTGEITLRGSVLAVGGIKEKALGALRHGITKVIIPFDNIKDLEEIPKEQRDKMEFIPVKHISDVLSHALLTSRKLGPASKRKRKIQKKKKKVEVKE